MLAEMELGRLRAGVALVEQQLREAVMMGRRKTLIAIADRLALLAHEGAR